VPDTSIIDRRLAMLAANPPAPDPTPDLPPETAPVPTPPAWRMDDSHGDPGHEGWSGVLRGQPDYPILVLTFLTTRDPDRPRRVQADGPERLAAEVLDAARQHPALGKAADLGRRIADAEDRRRAAWQAANVAKARRTLLLDDPPAEGLADALRANDAERKRAEQDADDRFKEIQVLQECRFRCRAEVAGALPALAAELQGRLRGEALAEHDRLLAEIDAFVSARAGWLAHLTAVAMHLNNQAGFIAEQAAEKALLGDGK
jgi:hypothetical protein